MLLFTVIIQHVLCIYCAIIRPYNPALGHYPLFFFLFPNHCHFRWLIAHITHCLENTPYIQLTVLPIKTRDRVSLLPVVQLFSCLEFCVVLSVKDSQHRWMTSDKGIFGWGCAVMSVMWLRHSNFRLPLLILKLQSALSHLQHCKLT